MYMYHYQYCPVKMNIDCVKQIYSFWQRAEVAKKGFPETSKDKITGSGL